MHGPQKSVLISLFLVSIFSTLFMAACSGPTLIDVNIDPTTGSGNVVINPPPAQPTAAPSGGTTTDMSQVALFAIVVILLLGVMAIVFSVARRPRR